MFNELHQTWAGLDENAKMNVFGDTLWLVTFSAIAGSLVSLGAFRVVPRAAVAAYKWMTTTAELSLLGKDLVSGIRNGYWLLDHMPGCMLNPKTHVVIDPFGRRVYRIYKTKRREDQDVLVNLEDTFTRADLRAIFGAAQMKYVGLVDQYRMTAYDAIRGGMGSP